MSAEVRRGGWTASYDEKRLRERSPGGERPDLHGRVASGTVLNVATGEATPVRRVLDLIADVLGVDVIPEVDPRLVRANDPPIIVGDATRLRELTGWVPRIPLRQTLADLISEMEQSRSR